MPENTTSRSSANEEDNQLEENISARRQSRRRKFKITLIGSLDQIDRPIESMIIPNNILFKFSSIEDMASVNHLFIIILPSKMASIKVNEDEHFFENYAYEPVEVCAIMIK